MASRYLRASGNWDGPVWAATSSGTAGSASTPTASDDVYLSTNRVVILTADAECNSILSSGPPMAPYGNIQLNEYDLHVFGSATAECTIDGNGTLTVDGNYTANSDIGSFPSLIVLNNSGNRTFTTYSRVFNDVRINMSGTGETLNITGSPTFRSLIIQSKNSAAHTVNFDSGATVSVDKFIVIGSGSSNKIILQPSSYPSGTTTIQNVNSSYGQYAHLKNVIGSPKTFGANLYIGSNSVLWTSLGWLLQDPPKISTLVDQLTTAPGSNPNWTFPDGYPSQVSTGHYGGGYDLTGGERMISVDTFDLVDGDYVVEQEFMPGHPYTMISIESDGSTAFSASTDGSSWTELAPPTIYDPVLYRSVRLGAFNFDDYMFPADGLVIGSINPEFAVNIDTNSASSSVSISTSSISRTTPLSVQGHGVGTSMSTADIQSVIVLNTDSIGTSTSMSEPSMVLIRGVLPNSISIGVSADNLDLLLKAGVLPDNMEIVTTSSIPSISGDIFIFTDDMLVGLNEDEVSVAALRNMDVDVMSIIPAILATAVQIGYPTGDINADNIYAIGSMREGEYGIATINNNQIYEVVEQDAI